MADKRLTYVLTARDDVSLVFKKIAAAGEDSNKRIGKSSDDAAKSLERQSKSVHLLSTGLLAVGAAAVPVAGVATGAVIGLGAAAGVAVVGVLGIRDAMKEGTTLGKRYEQTFKPIVSEFDQLKRTAAAGMFAGINSGVKALQPLFPRINRDVKLFSAQMGAIVGHVAPAFATLFTRVNPLFATFGDQLVRGSAAFQKWAQNSDSVGNFVAYVQTNLPSVEATFGSLVTTVSHVVMGLEPFGSTTLTALRLFSQAINTIPIGVLQTVIPLLAGLKVGNTIANSFNNAGVGLGKFADNIGTSGRLASGASGAVGKLGKIVGNLGPAGIVAGAALGGLSVIMGRNKQSAIEDAKRVNDLTDAIQDGTAATVLYQQLQKSGAVKAGEALGIDPKKLVQSAQGVVDLSGQLKGLRASQDDANQSAQDALQKFGATSIEYQSARQYAETFGKEVSTVSSKLQQAQHDYDVAKQKVADYARQIGDSTLASQLADDSYKRVASSLGLTGDQYINAKLAADKQAESTRTATAAMVLQNDAAGLLSASLQKLGGNNLGVAQSATQVALANNTATKALHDNGTVISGNSAKALANQQALQSAAAAALQHRQAVAQQTGSTEKATAAFQRDKDALEDQLRSQHRLTPAVQTYINTLFKIPATKHTSIDLAIDAAKRRAQELAAYIANYRPVMEATVHVTGAPGAGGGGHLAQRAAGGPVLQGTAYIVGERRPEVFVPDSNGRIIPNVARVDNAGSSGDVYNIAITVPYGGAAAGREVVRLLEDFPGSINIGRKVRA